MNLVENQLDMKIKSLRTDRVVSIYLISFENYVMKKDRTTMDYS